MTKGFMALFAIIARAAFYLLIMSIISFATSCIPGMSEQLESIPKLSEPYHSLVLIFGISTLFVIAFFETIVFRR